MWGIVPTNLERGHQTKANNTSETMEEFEPGECTFCNQEIIRNEVLKTWESESLIGYCPVANDRLHKPKIKGAS